MKNLSKIIAGFMLALIAIGSIAARTNWDDGVTLSRPVLVCTTLTVDTTATLPAVTTSGNITNSGAYVAPFDIVAITSPTVTITAVAMGTIQISTDVSQTGLTITGGTQGQIIRVLGTSDSATVSLTDGTSSMTLTGNLALGLGDTATLLCTSTDGDEWSELASADN